MPEVTAELPLPSIVTDHFTEVGRDSSPSLNSRPTPGGTEDIEEVAGYPRRVSVIDPSPSRSVLGNAPVDALHRDRGHRAAGRPHLLERANEQGIINAMGVERLR